MGSNDFKATDGQCEILRCEHSYRLGIGVLDVELANKLIKPKQIPIN